MIDLTLYYYGEKSKPVINEGFDKEIEKLANKYGLTFSGSGVELGKGVRDIHYIKKEKKNEKNKNKKTIKFSN